MKRHTAYKGCKTSGYSELQQRSITCTIISGFSKFLKSVLGTTLPVIAALACGCSKKDALMNDGNRTDRGDIMRIRVKGKAGGPAGHIARADIFVFNSDSLGRLDCYQKLEDIDEGEVSVGSTSGKKKIFVCCNLCMDEEDVMNISTVRDLEECCCMLEDVRRETPVMMGSLETETGAGRYGTLTLKPMVSTIVLNTIRCRFDGTPYEGEPITDARVYLTNVNAECNLSESDQSVRRFINMGMLNPDDMEGFKEPDLIVQDVEYEIGEEKLHTGITLMCFHNYCKEESPGSPFTRLVVEGKIQGEKYYWPLTVNRTADGEGVRNNTRHVFDLTIRRKGSLTPDEDIFIENSETILEVEQWKEMEEHRVGF